MSDDPVPKRRRILILPRDHPDYPWPLPPTRPPIFTELDSDIVCSHILPYVVMKPDGLALGQPRSFGSMFDDIEQNNLDPFCCWGRRTHDRMRWIYMFFRSISTDEAELNAILMHAHHDDINPWPLYKPSFLLRVPEDVTGFKDVKEFYNSLPMGPAARAERLVGLQGLYDLKPHLVHFRYVPRHFIVHSPIGQWVSRRCTVYTTAHRVINRRLLISLFFQQQYHGRRAIGPLDDATDLLATAAELPMTELPHGREVPGRPGLLAPDLSGDWWPRFASFFRILAAHCPWIARMFHHSDFVYQRPESDEGRFIAHRSMYTSAMSKANAGARSGRTVYRYWNLVNGVQARMVNRPSDTDWIATAAHVFTPNSFHQLEVVPSSIFNFSRVPQSDPTVFGLDHVPVLHTPENLVYYDDLWVPAKARAVLRLRAYMHTGYRGPHSDTAPPPAPQTRWTRPSEFARALSRAARTLEIVDLVVSLPLDHQDFYPQGDSQENWTEDPVDPPILPLLRQLTLSGLNAGVMQPRLIQLEAVWLGIMEYVDIPPFPIPRVRDGGELRLAGMGIPDAYKLPQTAILANCQMHGALVVGHPSTELMILSPYTPLGALTQDDRQPPEIPVHIVGDPAMLVLCRWDNNYTLVDSDDYFTGLRVDQAAELEEMRIRTQSEYHWT